jgi:hypothetical protein
MPTHADNSRQRHPGSHSIGVVPRIEGESRRVRYRVLRGAGSGTRSGGAANLTLLGLNIRARLKMTGRFRRKLA